MRFSNDKSGLGGLCKWLGPDPARVVHEATTIRSLSLHEIRELHVSLRPDQGPHRLPQQVGCNCLCDVCCCEECFWAAECAQAELAPVFEAIEYAFDDVARFVEVGVVFELHFAVFAGRNAGGRAGLVQPVA